MAESSPMAQTQRAPATSADDGREETVEHDIWSLERLELGLAVALAATTLLPWLPWGLASGGVTLGFNLIDALNSRTVNSGTFWLALVFLGICFALAGSIWETIALPEGRIARALALAGFLLAFAGAMIGIVAAPGTLGSGSSEPFDSFLDVGYWVALAVDVLGCAVAYFYYREPPNETHRYVASTAPPPPVAPPVPGTYPPAPDYIGHTGYPEHVGASTKSSYGPATFPEPGRLTPAYADGARPDTGSWTIPDSLSGVAGVASETGPVRGKSPGRLIVMADGQKVVVTVQPGQRLLVGRDPDAELRVKDPSVSPRHVTIERRGDRWVVQEIDAVNVTRFTDPSGTTRPVWGETPVDSGQLTAGHVTITLLSNEPGLRRD